MPTKPPKPSKKGEKQGGFIGGTVEAEAMPAQVLREILCSKVEGFMDPVELRTLQAAEESERDFLVGIAERLRA